MDEQLEFDLLRTCMLSVRCRGCGATLQKEIEIGASVEPVLKKNGWVASGGGYLCDACASRRL